MLCILTPPVNLVRDPKSVKLIRVRENLTYKLIKIF